MRFDVLTLFPELFEPHFLYGVTRRAFAANVVDVRLWQLRNFAKDNHQRVDDRPFGGGPGMVMLAEPIEQAIVTVQQERASTSPVDVVYFTPTGQTLNQDLVRYFAKGSGAILLCGRYEGVDQRVLDRHVNLEISLGDFVLCGGELPALALIDAVARLQHGVLHDAQSHEQDSFSDGLLDCPHYSRPDVWSAGGQVLETPAILLSGNHESIATWRRERALELTARRRPDLICAARAAGRLSAKDERFLRTLAASIKEQ